MKKLLFTTAALVLCASVGWGSTSSVPKDLSEQYPEKLATMIANMKAELSADDALYPIRDGKELRPVIP